MDGRYARAMHAEPRRDRSVEDRTEESLHRALGLTDGERDEVEACSAVPPTTSSWRCSR